MIIKNWKELLKAIKDGYLVKILFNDEWYQIDSYMFGSRKPRQMSETKFA
jgi:hypothetical protein